jgi:hypothetical protein
LGVAEDLTQVQVGISPTEVAEEQIKVEEKQHVLGFLPSFCVSYIPDATFLNSKQKIHAGLEDGGGSVHLPISEGARLELSKRKITSPGMGKARKDMKSASVPPMPTSRSDFSWSQSSQAAGLAIIMQTARRAVAFRLWPCFAEENG